jgi:transcriptional regulator with XRE-family HTH domain
MVTFAPDPLDVALGSAVRELRKQRKLSQADLGNALGITFQQIQKYERGTNRISFSALVKIANALGCRTSDLVSSVDGEAPPHASGKIGTGLYAEEALELLRLYTQIRSTELRRAVLNLAKAAAGA